MFGRKKLILAQIIVASAELFAQSPARAEKPEVTYAQALKNNEIDEAQIDAVRHHDFEGVKFLISKGANPDPKLKKDGSPLDESPLMIAAQNGDANIVKFLVDKGADVNRQDPEGETALMKALGLSGYNNETIETLLSAPHLDLYAADNTKRTVLQIAVSLWRFTDDLKLVAGILHHGGVIILEQKDNSDMTPLGTALGSYMNKKSDHELIDLLMQAGANPNATRGGTANVTLLHDAAMRGNEPVVDVLIEYGADINATTGPHGSPEAQRDTPMMWAAGAGHTNIVKKFIFYKVNIDETNKLGRTALMQAAMNGYADTVLALLRENAKADLKDINGNDALALAKVRLTDAPEDNKFLSTGLKKTVELLQGVADGKMLPTSLPGDDPAAQNSGNDPVDNSAPPIARRIVPNPYRVQTPPPSFDSFLSSCIT